MKPSTAVRQNDDSALSEALDLARSGRAAEGRRRLDSAREHYAKAEELLRRGRPTPLLANVLRWAGSVERDLGHVDEADRLYTESFDVAEMTSFLSGKASALNCRAVIAQRRGDVEGAVFLYRRAARLATEAGEIRLAGMIEQNLGVLANIRGDLDGALVRYRAALRAFQEVMDREAMSWVLNNMGMLLNDLRLPNRAEDCFEQGLQIARSREDRAMEGTLLTNYAETLILMERFGDAESTLEFALRIAREGQDAAREAEALRMLGVLHKEQGALERADQSLEWALRIATEVEDPLLIAETLRERGHLRLKQGRLDDALADWRDALPRFRGLDATLDADQLEQDISDHAPGDEAQTTEGRPA